MGDLFGYLPIIVFIVFGIIRAISGSNEKEQQQRKTNRPNVPRPTATPSGGQNNSRKTVYKSSNPEVYKEKEHHHHIPEQTVYTSTPTKVYLEEQQKQQLEELKDRLDTGTSKSNNSLSDQDLLIGPAIQDAIKHQSILNQNINKERFKKDVKKGLNYKGLVNGIIMSEVLGEPRARKPYRSVTAERRRNIHYK